MSDNAAMGMYFKVVLTSVPPVGLIGEFSRISGLVNEFTYQTYTEGGALTPSHLFDGVVPQRLILECGTITNVDLFSAWMTMIGTGICIRISGTVIMLSAQGEVQRMWTIYNAYPIKYVGPDLNAGETAFAVSRIELAYCGCN